MMISSAMRKTLIICASVSMNALAKESLYLNFGDRDCHKIIQSNRFFQPSKHSVDLVVKTFYRARSYMRDSRFSIPEQKLLELYQGSELREGILTLKFRPDSRQFLNGSSCEQAVNRVPLEKTLLKYPGVRKVIFIIGEESFQGFDA